MEALDDESSNLSRRFRVCAIRFRWRFVGDIEEDATQGFDKLAGCFIIGNVEHVALSGFGGKTGEDINVGGSVAEVFATATVWDDDFRDVAFFAGLLASVFFITIGWAGPLLWIEGCPGGFIIWGELEIGHCTTGSGVRRTSPTKAGITTCRGPLL